MNKILFSSNYDSWETPIDLFNSLDREFHFTIDVAASKDNAKCSKYFTKDDNALLKSWEGEVVFCNPPYGRKIIDWVRKSFFECFYNGVLTVMLIPARTDTTYFHDYILPYCEIRFLRGRLHFGNSKNAAPFPSMIVIFDPDSDFFCCPEKKS